MAFEGPFPQQQGKAIASYDWTTINTGVGYASLYGFSETPYDKVTSYAITDQQLASSTIESFVLNASANGIAIEKDFDYYFNRSVIIEGDLLAQVTLEANLGDASRVYAKVLVRKWDRAAETEIANADTNELNDLGVVNDQKAVIAKVVVPRTLFKSGEFLRITVQVIIANYQGTPITSIALGHDPINRDGTYIVPSGANGATSVLKISVPFKPSL